MPLEFFTSRIGRKIYRRENGCACADCAHTMQHGLKVWSAEHAKYLHMVSNEEGLRYQDEPLVI